MIEPLKKQNLAFLLLKITNKGIEDHDYFL